MQHNQLVLVVKDDEHVVSMKPARAVPPYIIQFKFNGHVFSVDPASLPSDRH